MNLSSEKGLAPTEVMHVSIAFGEDGRPVRLLHALSEDGCHVVCAAYSLHDADADERLDLPLPPQRAASAVADFARTANRRVVASDPASHAFLEQGWKPDETVRLIGIEEFAASLGDGPEFLERIVGRPAVAGLAASVARAHLISCGVGRPVITRTWREGRLLGRAPKDDRGG